MRERERGTDKGVFRPTKLPKGKQFAQFALTALIPLSLSPSLSLTLPSLAHSLSVLSSKEIQVKTQVPIIIINYRMLTIALSLIKLYRSSQSLSPSLLLSFGKGRTWQKDRPEINRPPKFEASTMNLVKFQNFKKKESCSLSQS